jgi:hypothetical protein
LPVYIEGQLSDLKRKSVEPIAKEAGVPPRRLREFLSLSKWDEDRMRDRLQQMVAQEHPSPHAVGGLVQSWWLNGRASAPLIDHIAEKIQSTQPDNAKAQRSHTKRTRRKLRRFGIRLTQLP